MNKQLAAFNTEAQTIETELSGDDFLALCGDTAWRVLWWERRGNARWYVKAERIQSQPEADVRIPYRDD